jgi:hypothetical protein
MDIKIKTTKKRKGGKGHKPNMAAKRSRELYKARNRRAFNKKRKAHKEEVKAAKLARKRARRAEKK